MGCRGLVASVEWGGAKFNDFPIKVGTFFSTNSKSPEIFRLRIKISNDFEKLVSDGPLPPARTPLRGW